MIDRATRRPVPGGRLLYRGQVRRCEVCIFVVDDSARVFVGGGEHGYDSLVDEVDRVGAEALAERFGLPELRELAARMPSTPG